MSSTGRFLLRAVGLLLLVGAIAIGVFFPAWGMGAVACFTWSMVWALVLGVVGFKSMQKGLQLRIVSTTQVQLVLLIGLASRLLILCASQVVVFAKFGREWGSRTLLATAAFYVLVLGVEIYTLAQELGHFGGQSKEGRNTE